MVVKKSNKIAKYTYAERVLGALSQVQKEHRKHAVHLATLRSQIRKTAEAKKDKLGPQWTHWVGRAVHSLEEQGVLAHAQPQGSVTLTPDAKKTISAARRHLSAVPTPQQEDALWRDITHDFGGRGLKRKKYPRRRQSTQANIEDDSEDEEEVLGALKRGAGKKARTSSVSPGKKKPISKMTKAELQAELRTLSATHAQGTVELRNSRSTRANLDSGYLREELQERQNELEAVREELEQVKRAMAKYKRPLDTNQVDTEDDNEDVDERRSMSPLTPEPSFTTAGDPSSSPVRAHASTSLLRAPMGMIRTSSGTFISHLSKQPTPAPSDSECDGDQINQELPSDLLYGLDGGEGGPMDVNVPSASANATASGSDAQLITPLASPVKGRAGVTGLGEPASQTEQLRALMEAMKAEALERERSAHDKISALQSEVDSFSVQLKTAQANSDVLLAEKITLERALDTRASEITAMRTEFEQTRGSLVHEKDQAEQSCDSLSAKIRELQITLEEREAHIKMLTQDGATRDKRISELDETLFGSMHDAELLRTELDASRAKMAQSETTTTELQSQYDIVKAELVDTNVQTVALREELRAALVARASNTEDLAAANARIVELSREAAESQLEAEALQNKLTVELEHLRTRDISLVHLESQMSAYKERVSSLERKIADLQGERASLHAEMDELRSRLNSTSEQNLAFTAELKTKSETITALESSESRLSEEVSALKEELVNRGTTVSELELTVDELTTQLNTSSDDLAAEQQANSSLGQQIASVRNEYSNIQERYDEKEREMTKLSSELVSVRSKEAQLNADLLAAEEGVTELSELISSQETLIDTLEASLQSSKADTEAVRAELNSLTTAHDTLTRKLDEAVVELTSTRAALESERTRSASLDTDVVQAVKRAQEAEADYEALKIAKDADATTIEELKGSYANLRKRQMDCFGFSVMQVGSAQSSPVPSSKARRRTANGRESDVFAF